MPEPIANVFIDLIATITHISGPIKHHGRIVCMFNEHIYSLVSLLLPYLQPHLSIKVVLLLKLLYVLTVAFVTAQVAVTGWLCFRAISSSFIRVLLTTVIVL